MVRDRDMQSATETLPMKRPAKNVWDLVVALQGHSYNAKYVAFWALFSTFLFPSLLFYPLFLPLTLLSPLPSPTLPLPICLTLLFSLYRPKIYASSSGHHHQCPICFLSCEPPPQKK